MSLDGRIPGGFTFCAASSVVWNLPAETPATRARARITFLNMVAEMTAENKMCVCVCVGGGGGGGGGVSESDEKIVEGGIDDAPIEVILCASLSKAETYAVCACVAYSFARVV